MGNTRLYGHAHILLHTLQPSKYNFIFEKKFSRVHQKACDCSLKQIQHYAAFQSLSRNYPPASRKRTMRNHSKSEFRLVNSKLIHPPWLPGEAVVWCNTWMAAPEEAHRVMCIYLDFGFDKYAPPIGYNLIPSKKSYLHYTPWFCFRLASCTWNS